MSILTAVTWIMFIGLLPLSIFWLRRAWIIGKKRDYSYVALKKGLPPNEPERYAKYSFALNLIAGLIFAIVFLLVLFTGLAYENWTAVAGITLWMKFLAEFILSRKAHMKGKK